MRDVRVDKRSRVTSRFLAGAVVGTLGHFLDWGLDLFKVSTSDLDEGKFKI